jgi:hypothetical protein
MLYFVDDDFAAEGDRCLTDLQQQLMRDDRRPRLIDKAALIETTKDAFRGLIGCFVRPIKARRLRPIRDVILTCHRINR